MGDENNLDTRGLKCPLPVLKARKRLKSLQKGDILHVQSDDPVAVVDFPHFCHEQGHDFLDHVFSEDGSSIFIIKK